MTGNNPLLLSIERVHQHAVLIVGNYESITAGVRLNDIEERFAGIDRGLRPQLACV